ncbi:phosphoribosylformylglycinamidine synthase subunit PurS [Calditrichota bacterium]
MKAKIKVMLKKSILDPQGKAVLHAIKDMKMGNVSDVRIGKYIEMQVDSSDLKSVKSDIEEICNKLLSNPVMENYEIEFEEEN